MLDGQPITLSFSEARQGYENIENDREDARDELTKALEEKAQAEFRYRKGLSLALTQHRAKGHGSGDAQIHAKADAAGFALERDLADSRAKAAQARLEALEGKRASVRQMVDLGKELAGG